MDEQAGFLKCFPCSPVEVQQHPDLNFSYCCPYCTQIFVYAYVSHTFACTCGICRLNIYSSFQELWKTMIKKMMDSFSINYCGIYTKELSKNCSKLIFFMAMQNNSNYSIYCVTQWLLSKGICCIS